MAEEFLMDKESVYQILIISLKMRKVYAEMVP
jgi:hypothetical protein